MVKRARTNYRVLGNVIGYGKASIAADASGVTSVSTGLKTPRFGLAFPRTTSSRNLRAIKGNYYTATGSTTLFQWFSVSGAAVLNTCVIAFNWLAFE